MAAEGEVGAGRAARAWGHGGARVGRERCGGYGGFGLGCALSGTALWGPWVGWVVARYGVAVAAWWSWRGSGGRG